MYRVSARQIAAALAVMTASVGAVATAIAQPSLTHVAPGAIAPGKTTELTLHGAKLNGPLRVWTSFPAQVEFVPGDEKQHDTDEQKDKDKAKGQSHTVCKVTLGAGVPVGIGGIAVANADGISDVLYLMIDDLPSIADGGKNHAANQPQDVTLPAAIDGQSDGTLSDHYRFTLKAGQQLSCEVAATRLGSDFDPLIRMLDAAGRELLLADDDASTGPDTRFLFTAPDTGQYLLELRDNRYKAGGRYRLRLGEFPLVSTPQPLVVQRGTPTEIGFRGPLGEAAPAITVLPIGGRASSSVLFLGIKHPRRASSGFAALGITELPVCAEASTRQDLAQGTPIRIPCTISGSLLESGERDLFQFQGYKGKLLRFKAISRSLGSPAIVSLRVRDAAGKQLAESPVTESDEPALSFTPTADGTYQLAIEELAGRGGGDFTYAVECRSGPQFSLLLKNDKANRLRYSLASGGAFYLDVQSQRAGYDGPITLSVDSERGGWQVINNVIAAKANETRLYVLPPIDLSIAEIAEVRIVGRAEASGREIVATMSSTVQLRAARPQTPYPPAWHEGAIFVSRLSDKPSFYRLTAGPSAVELPRTKGQAQLTLDFERTDPKFKDVPLTVIPVGLPAGITAEIKRNGNGPKEIYDIVLKTAKDAADGEHMFRYFAYAELAGQGRAVLSGDIRLTIVAGEMPAATEAKAP